MDKPKNLEIKTHESSLDLSATSGSRELMIKENATKETFVSLNQHKNQSKSSSRFMVLFLFTLAIGFYSFSMVLIGSLCLLAAFILFFIFSLNAKSQALTSGKVSIASSESALKKVLFETQFFENIGDHGENLYQQYENLSEKYHSYLKLLATKFNPNEITFQRYHAAVESIYFALLENFKKMSHAYRILSQTPIKELKTALIKETNEEAKQTLQNQIANYETQLNKTLELHRLNQSALSEIDKLAFALNEIKNSQTPTEADLKDMMKQLQELADRAQKYSL